jgi:hypothetical protein
VDRAGNILRHSGGAGASAIKRRGRRQSIERRLAYPGLNVFQCPKSNVLPPRVKCSVFSQKDKAGCSSPGSIPSSAAKRLLLCLDNSFTCPRVPLMPRRTPQQVRRAVAAKSGGTTLISVHPFRVMRQGWPRKCVFRGTLRYNARPRVHSPSPLRVREMQPCHPGSADKRLKHIHTGGES